MHARKICWVSVATNRDKLSPERTFLATGVLSDHKVTLTQEPTQ